MLNYKWFSVRNVVNGFWLFKICVIFYLIVFISRKEYICYVFYDFDFVIFRIIFLIDDFCFIEDINNLVNCIK